MEESKIISNVNEFIQKSLQHKGEYITEVKGKNLWVHPQVVSPKYSYAPQFFMQNWDISEGMTVLDIGTGSGILAIFAALAGAKRVIATDINHYACSIAEKNIRDNKVSDKIKVIESDLFAKIPQEPFNRILFNAPYWNRKADPSVPLTYGLFDENYGVLNRFLKESKNYLAPEGKILLGFSTQDDIETVRKMIINVGFVIEKEIRETNGHTRVLFYIIPQREINFHTAIRFSPKIAVFGSDGDHCTPYAKKLAYEVGKLLAKSGAVVYTGGLTGVMESASMGASDHNGLTVGIIASDNKSHANKFCSLIIPTGIGFARSQIITNSVDGAIIIEGGLGTLQEVAQMYWLNKPTIAIFSSGGIAKDVAGKSLDKRKLKPILKAKSAEEAVKIIFNSLSVK